MKMFDVDSGDSRHVIGKFLKITSYAFCAIAIIALLYGIAYYCAASMCNRRQRDDNSPANRSDYDAV